MKALRLAGVIRESIVDGPGIRLGIFAQVCPHKCPGCHNPATHDPEGGYDSDPQQILEAIRENPILQGVTFSGGDPFLQADGFAQLAREIHALGLSVITYTGYTMEQLLAGIDEHPGWRKLLEETDTLIDGPFLLSEKSMLLPFRGSRNQRVLDPRASLAAGKPVEKDFSI